MSEKKKKADGHRSEGFSGKRDGGFRSGKDKSESFNRENKFSSKSEENWDYDPNDKDELAPPRFLPKKDQFKDNERRPEKRGFGDKGPREFKGDKRNFDKKKPYGSDRGPKRGFKDDKENPGGFKDFRGNKREFNGDSRNDKRGFREDRKGKFSGDDRKNSNRREYKSEKPYGDKKPFRSQLGKNYKERIKELGFGEEENPENVRLNKYLANAGICSRREADELISQGLVSVNSKVITEMGYKVKPGDEVRYDGRKIASEPPVYIIMNKPKDFITTTDDDKGRKTVLDILGTGVSQRIYPIGRLDRNTTGVLLLTNDGDIAQMMTHPSFKMNKVYHVVLDKKVSGTDLQKMVEGFDLEDGFVQADSAAFVETEDRRHVGIEIHSGKNRVIRRMFSHLGYEVEKLDRVSMGVFTKKDLPRGKWRYLNNTEISYLHKLKAKLMP